MPHLSPILWIILPLFMFCILLFLSISLWFSFLPNINISSNSSHPKFSSWNWN